jgi:pimeloyl-ACP methyl ester carboxylesterase
VTWWLFFLGLFLTASVPLTLAGIMIGLYFYLLIKYMHYIVRIFQERPLFIIPRGQPIEGAEDVRFPTTDGLTLSGCYLLGKGPRRGVILFGLEFGSNRWSCLQYCEHLLDAGFDVFAFESRNQGDSDSQPGYDPLQWVTDNEVRDARAALAYLKSRPDADLRGVGFFGISKGAGAGLLAAADDPYVRCFVTDGVFATYTTVVPYMCKWYSIYIKKPLLKGLAPAWFFGRVAATALKRIEREHHCHFPPLEAAMRMLAPRPLFMIHGGGVTYIKPDMARSLFARARQPKQYWLVEGAKHNQALAVAGDVYRRRVREFFERHLAAEAAREAAA